MFFKFPVTWTKILKQFSKGPILNIVCCKKMRNLCSAGEGLCRFTCRGAAASGSPCSLKLQSKGEITAGPRQRKYWGYLLCCMNNVIYESHTKSTCKRQKKSLLSISCSCLVLISRCCCLPLVVWVLGWLIHSLALAPSFFCLLLLQHKVQSAVHTENFALELMFEVELKQLMLHELH